MFRITRRNIDDVTHSSTRINNTRNNGTRNRLKAPKWATRRNRLLSETREDVFSSTNRKSTVLKKRKGTTLLKVVWCLLLIWAFSCSTTCNETYIVQRRLSYYKRATMVLWLYSLLVLNEFTSTMVLTMRQLNLRKIQTE